MITMVTITPVTKTMGKISNNAFLKLPVQLHRMSMLTCPSSSGVHDLELAVVGAMT